MTNKWTERKRIVLMFDKNQAVGPNSSKFNKLEGTLIVIIYYQRQLPLEDSC